MRGPHLPRAIGCLFLCLFAAAASGCKLPLPPGRNIRSNDDLGDRKILAGRLIFVEGTEETSCRSETFQLGYRQEEGDGWIVFHPDEDCYVYVPLPVGRYHIRFLHHFAFPAGAINSLAPSFPIVEIRADDSIVSFCTLKVRFYQSGGSEASLVWLGRGRFYREITPAGDCEATQAELERRLGGMVSPIRIRNGGEWWEPKSERF
jgi:hypothetical protein